MKSSTKWLIGFGSAVGALVITAIIMVAVITGSGTDSLPSEDTPEGLVLRYFRALESDDYETAYGYLSQESLAEESGIEDFEDWLERNSYSYSSGDSNVWKASIGEVSGNEIQALVEIRITRMEMNSPLSSYRYSTSEWFRLGYFEEGWRITSPLDIPWTIR